MPRTLKDDDLDAGDVRLLGNIETYGFHISVVGAEGDSPGWAFSVGLHHVSGHPEIAVFGLSDEANTAIVSHVGQMIREGTAFRDGDVSGEVLNGYDCVFRTVDPSWFEPFLGYARWYYQGDGFPVLQCLWPDRDGHFPWEDEFGTALPDQQPMLYHADPDEARATSWLATMDGFEGET